MSIQDVLIEYSDANLKPDNDWYQWRDINPKFLPQKIVLDGATQYAQNVSLKKQLCQLYITGDDATKIELTKYYISVWGGVKRNHNETIKLYALSEPGVLIKQGTKGIASWSKALCIRDPNTYAIYDARVAAALNALQVLGDAKNPVLFPLLLGQNKLINLGSKLISALAKKEKWENFASNEFYIEYNNVISKTARQLKVDHFTIEMLLFANAPSLLKEAFPHNFPT